jgi:sulfhydrogenase subunit beta (sulfur reductase)
MTFKIIPKSTLPEWIDALCKDYRVIGPRPKKEQYIFDEIQAVEDVDLEYPTTILPPKKILLPTKEVLFRFKSDECQLEPHIEAASTIILGVHTCDMHAIALLDRVFSCGYPDQHYLARRAKTTLISIECLKPCSEHAFCKSMGTLSVPEAFDLHLTDLGEDYAVDIDSEKGEALLANVPGIREADQDDYQRLEIVMSEKWARFPYRLDFDVTELPSLLSISYDNILWKTLGVKCMGCGSCTIVCPTCYCFDVVDEVEFSLKVGERIRVWDSCQLNMFATVADRHNFRESQEARVRHRFFRKGKYLMNGYGQRGCVGCGRCAQACLVQISPVETFNELYRRQFLTVWDPEGALP